MDASVKPGWTRYGMKNELPFAAFEECAQQAVPAFVLIQVSHIEDVAIRAMAMKKHRTGFEQLPYTRANRAFRWRQTAEPRQSSRSLRFRKAPRVPWARARVSASTRGEALDDRGQEAFSSESLAQARAAAFAIAPGVLLAGVGGGMAFPILPIVGVRAGLSLTFIGVILAANRFTRVLVNPFVGSAVDRLGGKRLLIFGLVSQSLVLGCYLLGVVTGHPGALFLIGRLLHGPSSSCVFVAAQTLALNAGGRRHKGVTSGIVRSAMAAGMPVGLVLGGVLAGTFGPSVAFAVSMVAPLAAAAVAAYKLPDLRERSSYALLRLVKSSQASPAGPFSP